MIIRIRSKQGTDRVDIDENSTLQDFKTKVQQQASISEFLISKDPSGSSPLTNDHSTLKALGLKHGDMLYLISSGKEETTTSTTTSTSTTSSGRPEVQEDEVDKIIATQDGWVQRKKDPKMCKHGDNAKCVWCMPIAPWSIQEHEPWKSEGLKFIPFHAYVRKMQQNTPLAQKSESRPLEQPSYKLKPCTRHPPWPEGICTDCDPGNIRISAQNYRHVDHVEFESADMVDKFIQFWRETRSQRCGFLYGRYVPDDHVPLGICAQVEAIYEPPQKCNGEESVLENDPDEDRVDEIASFLGLRKIGFIWTDLQIEPSTRKIVKNRENLLTSAEIVRMAKMQNKIPSPCRQSTNDILGSKFVSVVVTGNEFGEVELQSYQVSDQCMSLVRDGIVTVSKKPDKLRVRKSTKQYVPEVSYTGVNEYKLEVIKVADPTVPSEFFIIPVRHGAPKVPKPLFKKTSFPIENRNVKTTLNTLAQQLERATGPVGEELSDFHMMLFLSTVLDPESLKKIASTINGDKKHENEVKSVIENLLKPVVAAASKAPAPSQPSASGVPTKTSAPPVSKAREDELIKQISDLGFTPVQAKEALWATNYQGAEAAIEFLLSSR